MNEESLAPSSYEHLRSPLTVHRYAPGDNVLTQAVAKALLDEGAHLVQQFRDHTLWHDVQARAIKNAVPSSESRMLSFTLSGLPPRVQGDLESAFSVSGAALKDWSEPPTANEIFCLDELEEFESSDFSGLLSISRHSELSHRSNPDTASLSYAQLELDSISGPGSLSKHSSPVSEAGANSEGTVEDHSRKAFMEDNFRLWTGSLQHIIQRPHMLPPKSMMRLDFSATKSHIQHEPIYLPPFTEFPDSDDYDRRAWIIPVRGLLPSTWTDLGASSAQVLDAEDSCSSPYLATVQRTKSTIYWSHAALKRFWTYLSTLRSSNDFGGLGVSFHPVPLGRLELESNSSVSLEPGSQSQSPSSLRDCDYFKVYHDALVSMHLRHALNLFTFVDSTDSELEQHVQLSELTTQQEDQRGTDSVEGMSTLKSKNLSFLEGAKLVLLNQQMSFQFVFDDRTCGEVSNIMILCERLAASAQFLSSTFNHDMLGVEGYGSGSESESEQPSKATQSTKKSSLSLPPPSSSSKAPAKKKKITIGLPTLKPADAEEDEDNLRLEQPPAKKPRLGAGKGSSSLLSMLPAPKQKAAASAPERVLGSGTGPGLVFNTSRAAGTVSSSSHVENDTAGDDLLETSSTADEQSASATSFAFRPPSIAKGKANISLEGSRPKAALKSGTSSSVLAPDFFGLGTFRISFLRHTTDCDTSSLGSASSSSSSSIPKITMPLAPSVPISSAPEIAAFEVPEPSVNDPYPGYYQLPSGEWRQHDLEYYEKFRKKWEKDYNNHIRALEKGAMKGFEGYDRDDTADVDAAKEMEKAKLEIKEREERKAVSKNQGQPEKPKMNITAAKLSGRARSRHQLATLLNEAFENREALEEKIAEGRRNRKEAGNKYECSGF
ncbi:hypothetical protein GYMLUDRAFT_61184 [Collybiopsis luxurians FD-317 M1]|uniref:Uncharacterized protein n=1 Tax=Collybiopsis luxurians FD-317 M1 TaxID=944289 RepID=A0A0D0C5J7_9AGAR|nr:hypothetical protein GYMLUDRAFT_61184 [Collybiopsis luxurians FD-317 M1]